VTHLGDRVAALIDGQLSAEATERAMAHLARCRPCRDVVDVERLTKARLACLADPLPAGDLVGRLLAMGGPNGPMPPRPGHVPGTPRPKPVPLSRPVAVPVLARAARVSRLRPAGRPVAALVPMGPGRSSGTRRRRARRAGAVLGALGVVGAGVGGLVLASPGGSAGGSAPGVDALTARDRSSVVVPVFGGRGPRFLPTLSPTLPVAYRGGR